MAFNGKLIELYTHGVYVEFPLKYIKAEKYKVTPNQRMEVNANRATTGILHRNTVEHTSSKIDFDTPPITNEDVNIINTMLSSAYTDELQRKLDIRYYDTSSDTYKTGTVYVPDIDYNILRVDKVNNIIFYDSVRIAFIEY